MHRVKALQSVQSKRKVNCLQFLFIEPVKDPSTTVHTGFVRGNQA